MSGVKSIVAKWLAAWKSKQLHKQAVNGWSLQQRTFDALIKKGKNTAFGRDHSFDSIKSIREFQEQVPIRNYEAAKPYFDRIVAGEADVSWPGHPLYLAKTSGTTSGAKYIPITRESIRKQINTARDALLLYVHETGNADFFDGKMMFLSGSPEIEQNSHGMKVGRLSGIVNHFVPAVLTSNRVPTYATNCIEDWEEKVRTIAQETQSVDLRLISGIPPWVQMFFEELEQQTGKQPLEVWPNLSVFVQGGVDFQPYKPIFDAYFGDKVDLIEVFPASEGFFAIQSSQKDNGLLLLPQNGIFYEFIPMDAYGEPDAPRLCLNEVELDTQYALIVSTNAGLWAYDIGDTVKFTSLNPYKLRVTGRTKHFISAFGEHVISEEVNQAIMEATAATGASFHEFTVAPRIVEEKGDSCHQWLIEFDQHPADMDKFALLLDQSMRKQNTYYDDLREGNILRPVEVKRLELHASRAYMKSQGKLGGQNKFPRLSNSRKIAEALDKYIID
ncbi:MAG: GH3 auxin-responsive promoter family protein [Bacteroidota bacterium]